MSSKLSLILCVVAIWAVDVAHGASASPHQAPAPSVSCMSLVMNMIDCLSFVSNDSTITKPGGTCCPGLKTLLETSPECLCEAFKSSASYGVILNVTKALTLPAVCNLSDPSLANCPLSETPAGAPAPQSSPASAAAAPDPNSPLIELSPPPKALSPPPNQAPAPSVSCMSLVMNMIDCLSFVSNDSTITKPGGTCCPGLKTLLDTSPECLCEAFKSSSSYGVILNVTKALTLPAVCNLSDPSLANCPLSETPAAPAGSLSPQSSPASASAAAAPGPNSPLIELSPPPKVSSPPPKASSPGNAASALSPISAGSLFVGLLVAVFSGF